MFEVPKVDRDGWCFQTKSLNPSPKNIAFLQPKALPNAIASFTAAGVNSSAAASTAEGNHSPEFSGHPQPSGLTRSVSFIYSLQALPEARASLTAAGVNSSTAAPTLLTLFLYRKLSAGK